MAGLGIIHNHDKVRGQKMAVFANRRFLAWLILGFQVIPLAGLDQAMAWECQQRRALEPRQASVESPEPTPNSSQPVVSHVEAAYEDLVITTALRTVSEIACPKPAAPTQSWRQPALSESSSASAPMRSFSAVPVNVKKSHQVRLVQDAAGWKPYESRTCWIGPAWTGQQTVATHSRLPVNRPQCQKQSLRTIFRISPKPIHQAIGTYAALRACLYLDHMQYSDFRDRLLPASGEPAPATPDMGWLSTVSSAGKTHTPDPVAVTSASLAWFQSQGLRPAAISVADATPYVAAHPANGPPCLNSLRSACTRLATPCAKFSAQPWLNSIHRISPFISREVTS